VHGEDGLHRKALEQAVFYHRTRPGVALFAGLKHQHRRAVEIARLREVTRRADQHGRVAVVATAVHQARFARFPAKLVVLDHGQGVHVGTQPHHAAAGLATPAHHRHHAGAAYAVVDFIDAAQLERLFDARAGIDLLKPQFRVRMQIAAQRRQFGVVLRNLREGTSTDAQTRG